jgi:hypothetical protein
MQAHNPNPKVKHQHPHFYAQTHGANILKSKPKPMRPTSSITCPHMHSRPQEVKQINIGVNRTARCKTDCGKWRVLTAVLEQPRHQQPAHDVVCHKHQRPEVWPARHGAIDRGIIESNGKMAHSKCSAATRDILLATCMLLA